MNHSFYQERLDEAIISSVIAKTKYTDTHGDEIIDLDRILVDRQKLEAAITALFNDVIGPDVEPNMHPGLLHDVQVRNNAYRKVLRNTINPKGEA